jgi:DNA (cytosine-5)-methyltransferase 1
MTHGSLFSGIGGFDLAAEWMGWENKFHCEWNEFGQKVLHHYWPDAELFTDITKSDFKKYHGTIDIISGGFPCQPYSMAGKRLGKEDDRHLWPEMLRVIREVRPRWVVGENVLGLVNWNGGLVFHEVQTDLEAEGYEVQPYVLPAAAVGAPHRRDRVWFVAHAIGASQRANQFRGLRPENAEINRKGSQTIYDAIRSNGIKRNATDTDLHGRNERNSNNEVNSSEGRINALGDINESNGDGDVADTLCIRSGESWERRQSEQFDEDGIERRVISNPKSIGQEYALENGELEGKRSGKSDKRNVWDAFPSVSPICSGNDGIPDKLDGITFSKWRNESIKAYGNAVVPQVVYQIFKAIEEYEKMHK